MAKYKISSNAENDLIRIHHYGIRKFGMNQADKYFNDFLDCFETIAKQPFALNQLTTSKKDIEGVHVALTEYTIGLIMMW